MSKLETIERPAVSHDSLSGELLSVMRELERLCQQLLEVTGLERRLVLDGRIGDLDDTTRKKNELMERMDRIEVLRRDLSARTAVEYGLPQDASLARIATRMEKQAAADLLELRQRVSDGISRLKDLNETNQMLVRKSLDMVRNSIRQLSRSVGAGQSYTPNGYPAMIRLGNGMVDRR
ncbi:MAG TPA: flagellar protein FlgN, partial [Chloroflexota bacterium]|nr:flagellar protein FlgN [Chloroflexota bacterium]